LSPEEHSSRVSSTTLAEGVLLPRFQHYSRRRSTTPTFPALLSPEEHSSRVSSTTLAEGVLLPRFQHYSRGRSTPPAFPALLSPEAVLSKISPHLFEVRSLRLNRTGSVASLHTRLPSLQPYRAASLPRRRRASRIARGVRCASEPPR